MRIRPFHIDGHKPPIFDVKHHKLSMRQAKKLQDRVCAVGKPALPISFATIIGSRHPQSSSRGTA